MRAVLWTVVLSAVFAAPSTAMAWKQSTAGDTGVCLAWGNRSITWTAASPLGGGLADDDALAVIRRSFGVWAAESCTDLRFAEGPRVDRTTGFELGGANTNTILVRGRRCADVVPSGHSCLADRSCANEYDCWEFDPGVIAMTTVTSSNCSGQILDADIEFNAAGFRFTTVDGPRCERKGQTGCVDMDLQNTLVHEIGHLIGLDHTDDVSATMYRSASAGETNKRALGSDDRAALCALYAKGQPARTCGPALSPEECANRRQRYRSTSGCAASTGGGGAELAAVVVVTASWLVARRRTRHGR